MFLNVLVLKQNLSCLHMCDSHLLGCERDWLLLLGLQCICRCHSDKRLVVHTDTYTPPRKVCRTKGGRSTRSSSNQGLKYQQKKWEKPCDWLYHVNEKRKGGSWVGLGGQVGQCHLSLRIKLMSAIKTYHAHLGFNTQMSQTLVV
jgi:hypothetical protein